MLSNKALLVHLSISQCMFRKLDKRATGHVETEFKTNAKVGNYTKKLLPGAKELNVIQAHAQSIRAYFYEQTLPWLTDGSRILSSKNYLTFTAEFRAKKSQFETSVASFLTQYPTLKNETRLKLGDLFSEIDYPSEQALRAAFSCDVSYMPLPDAQDFRTEVSDEEKQAFVSKMQDIEAKAIKECWTRLHEVCSKAASKLATPDAVFRDSLIENITEMCQLMPRLNVTDDPALETARREIETLVSNMSPDVCRENPVERQQAASKLQDIMNNMGAFMSMDGAA